MISRLFSTVVAAAASLALVAVPATTLNAPQATAQGQCPAVVVVAARGSGQNDHIYPTWYSPQAPFASNGWEGETIRAMFQTVESRYRATHGGNSVMKDVYVLGLEPHDYPATLPKFEVPNIARPETIGQLLYLIGRFGMPVISTAMRVLEEFKTSIFSGQTGVMNAIDGYERASGCHPQYVLAGFSQGTLVVSAHERDLAQRGQLAGAVYLGNPMTAQGDPFTVGNTTGQGGMLGWVFFNNSISTRATDNRVNYCLPLDGICDMSRETLEAANAAGGGDHGRYFMWRSDWDAQVADAIGSWVDQVRYH